MEMAILVKTNCHIDLNRFNEWAHWEIHEGKFLYNREL